jgi:protein-tyrosine phosphatase
MGKLSEIERTHKVAEVADGVWLGPMPDSVEFVRSLRYECGVTGVVSVQTDFDLRAMGTNWPAMVALLRSGDVAEAVRVPITDFDEQALAGSLQAAVDAVRRMRGAGHETYVHCTAGLNRSPTVAIGYLVADLGMSLEQAWSEVASRRRVLPIRGALDRWLAEIRRSA